MKKKNFTTKDTKNTKKILGKSFGDQVLSKIMVAFSALSWRAVPGKNASSQHVHLTAGKCGAVQCDKNLR